MLVNWSPKQFKSWKVLTVVGSIMVVRMLTCCALVHSICDLKVTRMNVQHISIQKLMLYEFKLGHNVIEVTKNLFYHSGFSGYGLHNYCYIHNILADMSSGFLLVFLVELRSLQITSNHILYLIH